MKKLILFLSAIICTNLNAQICFSPAVNFGAGSAPFSITGADFNGDGKADLAIANSNSGDATILLGTGTGSFGPATSFTAGTNPVAIINADFNGDGSPDLVVVNNTSNNISVLLGTGTGSFNVATNFLAGANPYSAASADFNGDGKLDLAVANYGSGNLSVLLGTGTGNFAPATTFTLGTQPTFVISADFNHDSKADLVTANNTTNAISILLGTGTGSFSAPVNFTAGTNPSSLANADFNGDGNLDLAVSNYTSNNVSILLGTGTGNFTNWGGQAVGANPSEVITADFNGDGKADLATANNSSNNVSVLLGTGTGLFSAPSSFSVGTNPYSLVSADFNGDTKIDLATANNISNNISILLSTAPPFIAAGSNPSSICPGSTTTLTASGVTTYTWYTTTFPTTPSITVSPGATTTYIVEGTDAKGCTNSASVTVTVNEVPGPPVYSGNNPVIECQGQTPATLSVTPTGTISATPLWYDGASHIANGNSYTPQTGMAGTTVFSVYDSSGVTGCKNTSSILTITVTVNPTPSLTVTTTNASCTSCSDGQATANILGGSAPYTYTWTPPGGTIIGNTYSNLLPGTYSFCVADVNGCMACQSFVINFSSGINNFNTSAQINIYPNPSSGNITIVLALNEKHNVAVALTDVLGRTFETIPSKQYTAGETKLSIAEKTVYEAGVYVVNLNIDGNVITKKIIIK